MSKTLPVLASNIKNSIKKSTLKKSDKIYVFQPNRVTYANYKTSVLIERIMTLIQYQLREYTHRSMNNMQPSLFSSEDIVIKFPLKAITHNDNLSDAVAACDSLMNIKAYYYTPTKERNKEILNVVHLVKRVEIPVITKVINLKKNSNNPNDGSQKIINMRDEVKIVLEQEQIDFFTKIDYNIEEEKPYQFTKYPKDTILKIDRNYYAKFYKIISSWKERGGFITSVETLKQELGVIYPSIENNKEIWKDTYPLFGNFKQRVLDPARDYFKEKFKQDADFECFFEYDILEKKGKKVKTLRFKIITRSINSVIESQKAQAKQMLTNQFQFNDIDFKSVAKYFDNPQIDMAALLNKIIDIKLHIDNNRATINNPKAFLITSLKNEFKIG